MRYLLTSMALVCGLGLCQAQDKPSFASSTISFPVSDLEKSTQWYQELLGEVERFSPAPGVMEFQLNDKTWLQLFEGTVAVGSILRLEVADIQAQHQKLKEMGVSPTSIELVPNVVSYFDFSDPDGNLLSFYKLEIGD